MRGFVDTFTKLHPNVVGYTFWLKNQLHYKKGAPLYWWIIVLHKCCNGAFAFRFLLTWYRNGMHHLAIQASLSDTYFFVHQKAVGEQGPYVSGVYTPKLQY